jgi:membrane protein implicated in regulation of membrane protease activity
MDFLINNAINPWILGAIGLALMALEMAVTTTFVAFWLGVASFAVALTTWILPAAFTWQWQIVLILLLAGLFYYFFSRKLESHVPEAPEKTIYDVHAGDRGTLRFLDERWVVEYQGTFWSHFQWNNPSHPPQLCEHCPVLILKADHNRLIIDRWPD